MFEIVYYTTARGDRPVQEFIESRSFKEQTKIEWQIKLLTTYGPNLVRPYADVVEGKIRDD